MYNNLSNLSYMSSIVKTTTYISILIQVLTGLVSIDGFSYKLPQNKQILKDILALESLVQFAELCMYIWLSYNHNLDQMALTRYYDWILTTPTMLLSTIAFLHYQYLLENNSLSDTFNIKQFVAEHKTNIQHIFVLNTAMLLCGYLGELDKIDRTHATVLGFIPFVMCFKLIYQHYGSKTALGREITTKMFLLWSIYGVAFMFPDAPKNIAYNFLDIIAKNFWGLFIYWQIKASGTK